MGERVAGSTWSNPFPFPPFTIPFHPLHCIPGLIDHPFGAASSAPSARPSRSFSRASCFHYIALNPPKPSKDAHPRQGLDTVLPPSNSRALGIRILWFAPLHPPPRCRPLAHRRGQKRPARSARRADEPDPPPSLARSRAHKRTHLPSNRLSPPCLACAASPAAQKQKGARGASCASSQSFLVLLVFLEELLHPDGLACIHSFECGGNDFCTHATQGRACAHVQDGQNPVVHLPPVARTWPAAARRINFSVHFIDSSNVPAHLLHRFGTPTQAAAWTQDGRPAPRRMDMGIRTIGRGGLRYVGAADWTARAQPSLSLIDRRRRCSLPLPLIVAIQYRLHRAAVGRVTSSRRRGSRRCWAFPKRTPSPFRSHRGARRL